MSVASEWTGRRVDGVVWELINERGIEAYGVIVIAAGLLQMSWAWLYIGQWFRAVSPAVIHGMLAGIGALILRPVPHHD